jgi:hypothetical protein
MIDNLPAHTAVGVCEAIETPDATLRYVPKTSPGPGPIEVPFRQMKADLRSVRERAIPRLRSGRHFTTLFPEDNSGTRGPQIAPAFPFRLSKPDVQMVEPRRRGRLLGRLYRRGSGCEVITELKSPSLPLFRPECCSASWGTFAVDDVESVRHRPGGCSRSKITDGTVGDNACTKYL